LDAITGAPVILAFAGLGIPIELSSGGSEEPPLTPRIRRRHTTARCRRCARIAEPTVRNPLSSIARVRANLTSRLRGRPAPVITGAWPTAEEVPDIQGVARDQVTLAREL